MKRIAALAAAVTLGLLAVPASTAMASTSGSVHKPVPVVFKCKLPKPAPAPTPVPGSTLSPAPSPAPVPAPGSRLQVICCGPGVQVVANGRVVKGHRVIKGRGKGGGKLPAPITLRAFCAARILTFDLPADSSTVTEVHGPRLHVHEALFYQGRIFTVASVSGDTFTVDHNGSLVTNGSTAIVDGRALVLAGKGPVVVIVGPPPGK
jgi:hypothetical protein